MAVFLYAFREREDLMDCYEAVSGAHARGLSSGRRLPRPAGHHAQYGETSKYRGEKKCAS